MVIHSGSGQTERYVECSVREGPIEETNEYKYLGFWITQKHTIMRQIEANKAKLIPMIREIKHIGNENKVGAMNEQIQQLLYETTVIPAVIYNMEVMTNVSKKEYDELEKIQKNSSYRNIQLTYINTILRNSVQDSDMAVEVHDYLSTNDAV